MMESVVDQTLVASLPDFDSDDHSGEAPNVELEEIPKSLKRDEKSLKLLIRTHGLSVLREERRHFWKGIYVRRESGDESVVQANAQLYEETAEKTCGAQNSPPRNLSDKNHANAFCLTNSGRNSVCRILVCVAYNQPDVQFCPELYCIAALLRHYLSEEDVYGLTTNMLNSRSPKFVSQTKLQHEIDWRTALELNKKYNKRALELIKSKFPGENLDGFFQNWLWWIFSYLPLSHAVRIMDCFLVEGQKVLLRTSLTLIKGFSKNLKSFSGSSSDLNSAFSRYCKDINVSPNVLLDKSFRFRGLSRASISKKSLNIEVDLKAQGFKANGNGSGIQLPDSVDSAVISHDQLIQIWHWLPARVTTVTPTLTYSSDEHGISLTTFYAKCEQFEQTIVMIKTTDGDVFGAYCSSSWAERKFRDDRGNRQTYFGTGETFLFKMGRDESVKYPWIDLKNPNPDLTKAQQHARELFMSAQTDMIAIGGGSGNGIYLDKSLTFGKSEKCETFNNDPLCPKGDFKVSVIEVIGLTKLDL